MDAAMQGTPGTTTVQPRAGDSTTRHPPGLPLKSLGAETCRECVPSANPARRPATPRRSAPACSSDSEDRVLARPERGSVGGDGHCRYASRRSGSCCPRRRGQPGRGRSSGRRRTRRRNQNRSHRSTRRGSRCHRRTRRTRRRARRTRNGRRRRQVSRQLDDAQVQYVVQVPLLVEADGDE